MEQSTVRDLLAQKQALLLELKQYDNNNKYNEDTMKNEENIEINGVIPANTRLQIVISANEDKNKKVKFFKLIKLYIHFVQ